MFLFRKRRSLSLFSRYSHNQQQQQQRHQILLEHSRFEDANNDLDGAFVKTTQSAIHSSHELRLLVLKGYNHQINMKAWEISSNPLRHNAGHVYDLLSSVKGKRTFTVQAKSSSQLRQSIGLKLSLASPGIILEPYKPPEPISFLHRWFTRRGWKRTKEDMISQLKNAYAVAKLRKFTGYSKEKFYQEAIQHYKETNNFLAQGDRTSMRQLVTENMYSILKKEIKNRETAWSRVHWQMIEPAVRVRTLQARLIGVDKNDLDKAFVQLTLEMITNQKFAAYDFQGKLVAGDKDALVLVQDIWVFERSLFQPGARWRLCGRISL